MLVGIVSDIHSNLPALRAVLGRMKRLGVSRLLCAGDLVGYYTFPNEVVELSGKAGIHSIAGNHERAIVSGDHSNLNELASLTARWTAGKLSATSLETLRRLQPRDRLELGGRVLLLVHGSPRDDNEYVFPLTPDVWPFGELGVDVLVMGHTHVQWQGRFGRLLVLNPGSVGQPRDGDPRAAFATLDTGDLEARLHRVKYDPGPVAAGVSASGLPARLTERLYTGF
jgi:putative phosphoesterase